MNQKTKSQTLNFKEMFFDFKHVKGGLFGGGYRWNCRLASGTHFRCEIQTLALSSSCFNWILISHWWEQEDCLLLTLLWRRWSLSLQLRLPHLVQLIHYLLRWSPITLPKQIATEKEKIDDKERKRNLMCLETKMSETKIRQLKFTCSGCFTLRWHILSVVAITDVEALNPPWKIKIIGWLITGFGTSNMCIAIIKPKLTRFMVGCIAFKVVYYTKPIWF